ncbi:ATP-binding cassette domain-containing protein [Glycomyces algeriensis]|uniref:Daunorubicin resistance protein DrrA family ABC transporter ATP-binding protein n=1 Tax=Glycomyces algeriensis TaxID=256037 RepID=A0A9W6G593_9ACTN|nr:ATP-binding cassette domain-containing protein [Glycomyces algeriensis]MDA1369079.1 ATP-binding cassette domain-containing protein [Glycomyces algeriensis]MDR7348625.1 ABC-2 type transport system ATP-binding protein [Glycomyces algeriensis]GLI41329.1 daunorubicin resistance protein DrrA family ABC transporter ATP-binding protein [Glycomyces algeriensis]
MPTTTVEASNLGKRFKDTAALDGFSITAEAGTVLGLLGPNGAGKTTTVRILSTLLRFDTGSASVAGFDVSRDARQVRRRIGLTGQQTAVDEVLTARQNLILFGKLFRLNKSRAGERADQLLTQFGLTEAANRQAKGFSGGMKRRLDLAASMILAPQVLFLDEPTTGLDPAGRREVWDAVEGLAADGTTVVLTTHYLDEADRLCDRIAVIDHGRNLVDDTPAGLKRRMGADRLEIIAADPADLPALREIIASVADGDTVLDEGASSVSAPVKDPVPALTAAATAVQDKRLTVADIGLRRPTLDEAFLELIAKEDQ